MIDLAKTLINNGYDVHKIHNILVGSGVDSLEAVRIVTEALEDSISQLEIQLAKVNEKVPMDSITILWHEGTGEFDGQVYTSWNDFNLTLEKIAEQHGDDCGYSKTKFQIKWADDTTYEGRLDVNTKDDKNIGQHMLDHLQFHTGEYCPNHLTEKEYNEYLVMFGEDAKMEARQYLDRYDIVV